MADAPPPDLADDILKRLAPNQDATSSIPSPPVDWEARVREMEKQLADLKSSKWEPFHALISVVLILTLAVVVIYLLYKLAKVHPKDADVFLRIGAIPLIVVSSVMLIIVGYSETQAAPAFALMGTLVGYLLSKPGPPPDDPKKRETPPE